MARLAKPSQPPTTFVPICPICSTAMVQVYDKNDRRLFACESCATDVIVPITAWSMAEDQAPRATRKMRTT